MISNKDSITQLGTESIGRLLMQYAVPAIIAMTASSLYNMIDSIFIGQGVGALAISGLALTFPLMNLAAAFGALIGIGGSMLISLRLGQRDYKVAQAILGNLLILNVIIGSIFAVVVLAYLDPILYMFGASSATVGYAREYMEVIMYGNVITHIYFGLNYILRSAGHPKFSMYATIMAVVINAVLDPIFIYGFGWGIRGAAIATVIAQVIALAWQIKLLCNPKELLHINRSIFKLDRKIVASIFSIGMSPFFMNSAACVISIVINRGLTQYGGDLNVGAYGIVNRVAFFFIMIIMGLNQGMQPIAGYNFGAKEYDRVMKVYKLTVVYAVCIASCGFLIAQFAPGLAVAAFTNDQELLRLSADGMRIVFLMIPLAGFQMVTANLFQSIGMAPKAVFLSLARQMLFLLPCLLILPYLFQQYTSFEPSWGIWFSMPLSDLLATIVSAFMLVALLRKIETLKSVKQ